MEILGIDVGGSGIKGAPVNIKSGKLISERLRIDTPQPATPEMVAQTISEIARHFNWKGPIGIGFPAAVRNGIVLTASNIDQSWIGVPINKFLSDFTGCSVKATNDADAAGIAEMAFGSEKDNKGVVLMLTVGTGIGTALFNQGILIPNTELGHMLIGKQTVENYASDAARKKHNLSDKKWAKRLNKVFQYFDRLFYPEAIIIGGGFSKKYDQFSQYINVNTRIVPAKLLNDAGIIGAAVFYSKNS